MGKNAGDVLPEPGAYTINYVVKQNGEKKTIVKRIVIVSSTDVAVKEIAEDEAVMTLNGENEIYLAKNSQLILNLKQLHKHLLTLQYQ